MATTTRQQPPRRGTIPSPKKGPPPKVVKKPPSRNSKPEQGETGFYGRPAVTIFSYGPSGVGKTSLWANMPRPMFVVDPQEEGIEDLVEFGQAPEPAQPTIVVEDWQETMKTAEAIANGKYNIQSAIFDSVTGFEKLCFQSHCEEHFQGDWSKQGFYAFQQGPKNAAKTDWPRFLDALDAIRRSGINVVLIGHSQIKNFDNPDGDDYSQFVPYLDKEVWQQTHRWAKAVIFYNHDMAFEKKGLKTKVKKGSESRFLYTSHSAAYAAKNRWGLEPAIDAGMSGSEAYENFIEAFKKAGNSED